MQAGHRGERGRQNRISFKCIDGGPEMIHRPAGKVTAIGAAIQHNRLCRTDSVDPNGLL